MKIGNGEENLRLVAERLYLELLLAKKVSKSFVRFGNFQFVAAKTNWLSVGLRICSLQHEVHIVFESEELRRSKTNKGQIK